MKRNMAAKLATVMVAGTMLLGTTTTVFAKGETYGITYWCESDFFKTIADSITEEAEADGNKTVVVDAQ